MADPAGQEMHGGRMKLDENRLREDLIAYHELAARAGLPLGTDRPEALPVMDEAALVDAAATLGWDFGKYVRASH